MAGFQGKRHSEETKRRQSELMRGRKHSPETLAKRHAYAEANRPSKDFLLSEIIQFRNEKDRLPRKCDMHKRKGYSGLYQYDYVFGSWKKALQSLPQKYQDEVKRRLQHEGTGKAGIRFRVFWRDRFTCQYCGRKAPEIVLELDHVIPVSKGGRTTMQNLVTACRECNAGKQAILLHKKSD